MTAVFQKEFVIRGLQALHRLAQQDLLMASMSANPIYWHQQALDRMQTYEELLLAVETDTISKLYSKTLQRYQAVCKGLGFADVHGSGRGRRQALEMFLVLCEGCKEDSRSDNALLHRPALDHKGVQTRPKRPFPGLGSGSEVEEVETWRGSCVERFK